MKLTDVVDRINGNVDRFTTDLEYYIGGEHFESNELEVTQKGLLKENLGKLGFKFHFAFQDRDVIFMARNPHLRKAGMVRFAGLCSDASYILRSKDESVLSQEYLAIMLQSNHFWDYCESHKVGSVNFANNWSSIANYEFELPTPEYQKDISDKVWSAYRLKKSYKKLLSATEEMVKSQFIEMFGDPSVDTKWPTKKLKELGSLDRGVSKARPRNTPELLGGPYPLIQTGDITEAKLFIKDYHQTYSELGLAQSKMWKRGTLCITIAANIAQTAILDIDACFPDSVVGFIPYEVETIFIHYWFSFIQQVLERQAPQTAQKNINLKILSELDVIVPPKELQSKFVNIVLQADKSEFELRKSIDAIDAVIKSLINS